MQILREQVKILKSDVGCSLVQSNYHEVVKGFGAEGKKRGERGGNGSRDID